MPDFEVALSAYAAMTARIAVTAATPQKAAAKAVDLANAGIDDWEFVDRERPADGSIAVDMVYDADGEDELFAPPVDRDPHEAALAELIAAAGAVIADADAIAGGAEPDGEDYHDTESANARGREAGLWDAAARLRPALAALAEPPAPATPADRAKAALDHLVAARELLKAAGCSPRMLDRVRAAISSAKGAVRHAGHKTAGLV